MKIQQSPSSDCDLKMGTSNHSFIFSNLAQKINRSIPKSVYLSPIKAQAKWGNHIVFTQYENRNKWTILLQPKTKNILRNILKCLQRHVILPLFVQRCRLVWLSILIGILLIIMQNTLANTSAYSEVHQLPFLDALHNHSAQSFSDSEDDIDEDRCYLMEIEQLKRENNFLKKKIAELNKRHPALTPFLSKKKSLPPNIKPAESILSLPQQNYVVVFFEEITRLLQSFSDLFRVGIQSSLREHVQRQQQAFSQLLGESTQNLSRRLGRVLLQPEEKRFGELLGIFESYYVETTDRSKALKGKVEQLTSQAIELGKKMAENIRNKEKMKSSRIFSAIHVEQSPSEDFFMKSSNIKSTCTDSQLDLSGCKMLLEKEKFFNIF